MKTGDGAPAPLPEGMIPSDSPIACASLVVRAEPRTDAGTRVEAEKRALDRAAS